MFRKRQRLELAIYCCTDFVRTRKIIAFRENPRLGLAICCRTVFARKRKIRAFREIPRLGLAILCVFLMHRCIHGVAKHLVSWRLQGLNPSFSIEFSHVLRLHSARL